MGRRVVGEAKARYEKHISIADEFKDLALTAPSMLIAEELSNLGGTAYAGLRAEGGSGRTWISASGESRVARYSDYTFASAARSLADISASLVKDLQASVFAVAEKGTYEKKEDESYELKLGERAAGTAALRGSNVEITTFGAALMGEASAEERTKTSAAAKSGWIHVKAGEREKEANIALIAQAVREIVRDSKPVTAELGYAGVNVRWSRGSITMYGSSSAETTLG